MKNCLPRTSLLAAFLLALAPMSRATDVLSYHNDRQSTGQNLTETKLTPANVSVDSFRKRFAFPVDGQVYAQPLYKAGLAITAGMNPGTHDTVFVATEHDTLYAIDAASGAVLWQISFLASGLPGATRITSVPSADVGTDDLKPEIGMTGTPVIDAAAGLLFVVAKTKQIVGGDTSAPHYVQTLYKIDIHTGAVVASKVIGDTISSGNYTYRTAANPSATQDPFVVGTGDGAINVGGQSRVYFNALRQMNRPGLVLLDGRIYIAFASHGDNGPYHGWLLSYDAGTLALTGALNTTPNGGLGGVWQAGGIPAVDEQGSFYFETGNGTFDGNGIGLDAKGFPKKGNYGDCFVKVGLDATTTPASQNVNGWGMKVVDYFSPFNNAALDRADTDLGSGGLVILPNEVGSAAHPHLLIGSGKEGKIYLIDREKMGGFDPATDHVVQTQGQAINGSLGTPAYYNGRIYYVGGYGDKGRIFTIANGAFSATGESETALHYDFPGTTPSISANGLNNGLVWTLERGFGQLRAHPADDFTTAVWTSASAPGDRDRLGTHVKFSVPTVADGRVFVGTTTALVAYGPPAAPLTAPAAPSGLQASVVSGIQINLTWLDHATNEDGFKVEQSSDGITFREIATLGVNTSAVSVTGLQVASTYYFRVRAFNAFNELTYSEYSPVASVATAPQPPTLDFTQGFRGSEALLAFNGSAGVSPNNTALLTAGGSDESGSVWTVHRQPINRFTSEFTFRLTDAVADGFTFAIQNIGPLATGRNGTGLGYGGILRSVAIKFDLYPASSTTGLYLRGGEPGEDGASLDMSAAGIDLHSGHLFKVALVYNFGVLTETVTDTVTAAVFTTSYRINLAATNGLSRAFLGFTGGTGGQTAVQEIVTWGFAPIPSIPPAAPSRPVAMPASGTQINLTWKDNANSEAGFIVERRAGLLGGFAQVGVTGANTTAFMDTALNPNATYFYRIRSTNGAGKSTPTGLARAITPIAPVTPTDAQATAISSTEVDLTWTDNAQNETSYRVLRKASTSGNFIIVGDHLPPNTKSFKDTTAVAATTYDYHVQCSNLAGYSDFAGVTVVTP